jgi:hypothetical protein
MKISAQEFPFVLHRAYVGALVNGHSRVFLGESDATWTRNLYADWTSIRESVLGGSPWKPRFHNGAWARVVVPQRGRPSAATREEYVRESLQNTAWFRPNASDVESVRASLDAARESAASVRLVDWSEMRWEHVIEGVSSETRNLVANFPEGALRLWADDMNRLARHELRRTVFLYSNESSSRLESMDTALTRVYDTLPVWVSAA